MVAVRSTATDDQRVVQDLVTAIAAQDTTCVILVFASATHDTARISGALRERWPEATVLGCTTSGEFTESGTGVGGVVALALSSSVIVSARGELVDFSGTGNPELTTNSVRGAVHRLQNRVGRRLSELNPGRWLGMVFIDGLHGEEEAVNLELARRAPFLSFVGGSAGDDLRFGQTRVFCNGAEADHGAALLLLELSVPYAVLKSCSFAPTDTVFTVTRAHPDSRTVFEFNHRPVLEAYAEAVGVDVDDLGTDVFMEHPVGIMIDGAPWIRSPLGATPDGGLGFYCQLAEGTRVHLMRHTDLVGDMRTALEKAYRDLDGKAGGAVLFNCILRRLEMDAHQLHDPWLRLLAGQPSGGFHTYGESWLGHLNQTCVGVLFGVPADPE